MTKLLSEDLIAIPQREVAGSRSSKQFSYQKNWALAELIEYHLAGKNYVFAFEFHDDVLILDSENNPTSLTFVQIKTRTNGKNWSIVQLTKSESGDNKLSIIAKLFENKLSFRNHTCNLIFATNVYFSFCDSTKPICGNTLNQDIQSSIITEIQKQLQTTESIDLGALYFERSSLSVDDHEIHIRGKLHNFFDSLFGTSHNISVSLWYQSISDHIKKKNDFPPNRISNFDELIKKKCITRSEIENFIQKVKNTQETKDLWKIIQQQLFLEGYNYQSIITLHKYWKQYEAERLDYENTALRFIEQRIANEISKHSQSSFSNEISLSKKVEEIKLTLTDILSKTNHLFNEEYITCVIMWLHCEQL